MLIDLFFLPVHVPVGAPDVAQQILAVCKVVVVELVLTKNSFGCLSTVVELLDIRCYQIKLSKTLTPHL